MTITIMGPPDKNGRRRFTRYANDDVYAQSMVRIQRATSAWINLTGRDPHGGGDRPRYGYTVDGKVIPDGPHFDPEFLTFLRTLGKIESERLDGGGPDAGR